MQSIILKIYKKCQDGGVATQSPAERFYSGSNPDLGFSVRGLINLILNKLMNQI